MNNLIFAKYFTFQFHRFASSKGSFKIKYKNTNYLLLLTYFSIAWMECSSQKYKCKWQRSSRWVTNYLICRPGSRGYWSSNLCQYVKRKSTRLFQTWFINQSKIMKRTKSWAHDFLLHIFQSSSSGPSSPSALNLFLQSAFLEAVSPCHSLTQSTSLPIQVLDPSTFFQAISWNSVVSSLAAVQHHSVGPFGKRVYPPGQDSFKMHPTAKKLEFRWGNGEWPKWPFHFLLPPFRKYLTTLYQMTRVECLMWA